MTAACLMSTYQPLALSFTKGLGTPTPLKSPTGPILGLSGPLAGRRAGPPQEQATTRGLQRLRWINTRFDG